MYCYLNLISDLYVGQAWITFPENPFLVYEEEIHDLTIAKCQRQRICNRIWLIMIPLWVIMKYATEPQNLPNNFYTAAQV